jgi:AraC family transcriptional activator of tynA and feaB
VSGGCGRERDVQVSEASLLAVPGIDEPCKFGFAVRAAQVGDAVISEVSNESFAARTATGTSRYWVLMHQIRRGAWRSSQPGGQSQLVTAPAGSFTVCHDGPPLRLEADPGTVATVLYLPASALGIPASRRHVTASARSAEARVLMAHADMVREAARDLTPVGAQGARDALLELARAVLWGGLDGAEPRLAAALARAAMQAADDRLADADLSPALLAGELNVSVRTLHRAFAAAGEPVAAYIRRRRLEQARMELAARPGPPDISLVAARWRFADSSHFARAFKKQYGQTPSQFARASKSSEQG